MNCRLLLLSLLIISSGSLVSQAITGAVEHVRAKSFYLTWGYNRSHYTPSDIHFFGPDIDFHLLEVRGHDIPLPFEAQTYLNPLRFTIPQFDFRVGYFIRENLSISAGWDHMKYRMQRYQRVKIDGHVSETFSEDYAGTYSDQTFDLDPSFIRLEHTNGLNYIRLGVEHYTPLWASASGKLAAELSLGLSAGPVATWTDAYVDEQRYENWLDLAGYGVSGLMSLKLRYRHSFYLQYQHQNGFINLTNIRFMDSSANRAAQKLWFTERSISIGFEIPLYIGGNPNKPEASLE